MDDWNAKPLELVREEVRAAIEGHLRPGDEKDDAAYEQLRLMFLSAGVNSDAQRPDVQKAAYTDEKPSTKLLKQYISALTQRVSDLRNCGALMSTTLDTNWVGREEGFVMTYMRYLGALGSAVPGVLRPMLDKIVHNFVTLPSSYGRLPGEPRVGKQQMLSRVHNTIKYLQRLIPSASTTLAEALRREFPNHHTVNKRTYIGYVKNMLLVTEYAPELKGEILTLITERLVKLDVEVQEEIDDLEEEDEEMVVKGVNRAEGGNKDQDDSDMSDESGAESDASSDLEATAEEKRLRALRETVDKMDAVLDLLFAHYTDAYLDNRPGQANDSFHNLLSQFENFVLPTYRSRHTQFLVFHFSQVSQYNVDLFLDALLRIAFRRTAHSHSSLSAVAYLSSYIARGAHVPKRTVREIFQTLGRQLTTYRLTYEPTCRGPDLARYSLFYAVVQAMLYIYCFRWRDLILLEQGQDEESLDDYDVFASGEPAWIPGIKETLYQSIYSRLNPLKVCAPPIVQQFAAIAHHLRFMYVFPLLETNKRLRLSSYRSLGPAVGAGGVRELGVGRREGALAGKKGEAHHQLDAFFPFDPYQLPMSKRWLEGDYVVWKGVPGMKKEDDDTDVSSDESEDDDELEMDGDVDEMGDADSLSSQVMDAREELHLGAILGRV
ncbi:DNA independent RNA polymerase I transcription factor [Taxawa tesnikishii (nom. ined.)]|nr:DNA independent RNA polymerase I transcription factor [Dothideales sp. JES 119]